jgi:hypothetical protein
MYDVAVQKIKKQGFDEAELALRACGFWESPT